MSNDDIQLVDQISTSTETTNDDQELVDEMDDSQELVDEWVVEIGGRLEKPGNPLATRPSMDSDGSESQECPSIFGKWQCWNDFGASFIPETLKWHYVACMTHWFGLNVRSYLKYMQENEDLAWSHYRGVDEQFRAENSKRFIEHLLLNSCFLIFALLSRREHETNFKNTILDQNNLPKGLMLRDIETLLHFISNHPMRTKSYMLTMNYQIPWFVVEVVYTELSNLSKIFVTPVHKLANSCFYSLYPLVHPSKEDGGTVPEGGFKHLLHIFHWSRSPHGMYLISNENKTIGRFHIPSATELQLSQTVFETYEDGSIDISYSHNSRLSRVMKLTPWHLLKNINKRYESLLIFEREYEDICQIPFTAYVTCMTCLLKTEADIRLLRENEVIPSTTYDDKDVLRCVQELKNLIHDNYYLPNELVILEENVMAHYQRSRYRVYGEFKKRYCSNPWITISVIAAILLFILTFIQTVLSFIQTKYSVLSYKKQ